ncbi:MAG: hypothetical protein GC137_08605 [Alphaproteobacteria bacterium]|nr:hypothetical protein [Alphaproteobacteria bacterium]
MAHTILDDFSTDTQSESDATIIKVNGEQTLDIPSEAFVRDADISRDGMDLILEANGETITIEGYFSADVTPTLMAPNGIGLTPDLVNSFMRSGNEFADASSSMTDTSPVGAVHEVTGDATVTRTNGTVEKITLGTPIYQGDVVETDEHGAVNIMFIDETKFAVSEDARLAIDEYVFDPSTNEGVTNFSVLKGVFVFTSGLIGRDDPDDVMIETPAGSIGIRGTIIAGNVDTGEVTVIEGAIVMHDLFGNSLTLANQYETAQFNPAGQTIDPVGQLSAEDVGAKFSSVSTVSADLFSSILDSSIEGKQDSNDQTLEQKLEDTKSEESVEGKNAEGTNEDEEQSVEGAEDTQENNAEDVPEEQPQEGASLEETLLEGFSNVEVIDPLQAQQSLNLGSQGSNVNITSGGSTALSGSQPAPPPFSPLPPPPNALNPFKLNIDSFAVTENSAGNQLMFQITSSGAFSSMTNVQLLGISNNFYNIVQSATQPNTFEIYSQSGLNFENPQTIWVSATDGNGNQIIQSFQPNITNVQEGVVLAQSPTPTGNGAAVNAFAISDNTTLFHDFSSDFKGEDAGNLIFTVSNFTGGVSAGLFDASLIAGTSNGTWNFTSGVATNFTGTFDITATNSVTGAFVIHTYTLESFAVDNVQVFAGTGTQASPEILQLITGTSGVYSGNSVGYNISDIGITLFANGIVDNFITSGQNGSKIYSGAGEDEIRIQDDVNGFEVYAGEGNDHIIFGHDSNFTGGFAFGDEGNDTFEFTATIGVAGYNPLASASGTLIDGGSGAGDVIVFSGTGNDIINFTLAGSQTFKNIEAISTDGNGADTITLSYQNVIDMTDGNNTLVIDIDASDTFNFDLTGAPAGQIFSVSPNQVTAPNGESYYQVTDGVITLFVDADIAAQF